MNPESHTSPVPTYKELPWLVRPPADFNKQVKAGTEPGVDAGRAIRALASTALNDNQLTRLASRIESLRKSGHPLKPLTPWKLGLLTNSTSDFLASGLVATGARYGMALECVTAGYDQALQEALNPESTIHRAAPEAVLIALDWRGLPFRAAWGQPEDAAVEAVLGHLRAIRNGVRAGGKCVCIFQNLAPPVERVFGSFDRVLPGTLRRMIDRVNEALALFVRENGDVLVDIAGLAETVGLENWHSPGAWNLARLPFAMEYLPLYADHVCRAIAALRGKSRRCLVLDLDNTLWGGVVGDDGVEGISVAPGDAAGEAFLDFQSYALSLRERGIVLAVCSKNDEKNARAPFRERAEMRLKEQHFAAFVANWNDKATNIRAIAETLSLGLDSFVFADDNPFERELVRRHLPEVAVPELPADPALYTRTLAAAGYFDAIAFSDEDAKRAAYYEENSLRSALACEAGDIESYLASLDMHIWFRPFDRTGLARITQLINKSNQFNLTTRRYTEEDVAGFMNSADHFTLQVRLTDTFGDNGMISAIICRAVSATEWEVDTWLMSCRVLGRRVENMVLRELLAHAGKHGVERIRGVYIPTDRNKLVEQHYAQLGFTPSGGGPDGATVWAIETTADVVDAPMTVHSEGFASPRQTPAGIGVD